jgi:uncharacterized protein YjbI with pentapeptide repeats
MRATPHLKNLISMFVVPEIFSIFVLKSKSFVMKKRFFFIFLISFISTQSIISQCNHPDYAGLMELYNSTGGPNWTNNTGWKEGAAGTNCDPCNGWFGVFCSNGRVSEILLSGINGTLPNFTLDSLVTLNLFGCTITSPLPDFKYLKNLENLSFGECALTGRLPDFNLENLINLEIFTFGIEGPLPDFQYLRALKTFYLYDENLRSHIPYFRNSENLESLTLKGGSINGQIPTFKNLKYLKKINFSNNMLIGSIPELSHLNFLKDVNLSNNNLSGCYLPYICNIESFSTDKNNLLPWKGDYLNYCVGGSIFGAICDDGINSTIEDQILNNCVCLGTFVDTCNVLVYDTVTVIDTIFETISDTTFITITENISVTDTLIINLNIPNSSNDPITNRIIVYPNPTFSHITIDFGNHSLMQNYTCQILNTLGQPVYFTPIDQKLYYLDLNTWGPKGTYFLKIINDFGQTVETKKIILQ